MTLGSYTKVKAGQGGKDSDDTWGKL